MCFTKLDMFGPVWPCLALFGPVWPCLALFGPVLENRFDPLVPRLFSLTIPGPNTTRQGYSTYEKVGHGHYKLTKEGRPELPIGVMGKNKLPRQPRHQILTIPTPL